MPSMASQPPTSPPTAPTRPGIAPSTPSRWLTCSTRSAVSYWPPNFCHLGWSCPPWKNSSTRRQPALPTRHEVRNPSHNWMREFVSNLQAPGVGLDEVKLNPSSLELGEEKLRKLRAKEYEIIKGDERRKRWTVVEYALTVVGVGAAVGIAFANPLVALGVFGPLAGFGGWVAAKRAAPEAPARPLGGASMFVTAERRLGWSSGPV